MKSKTKRLDKKSNKVDKHSGNDRKIFYNPIFVDDSVSTLATSAARKKSKRSCKNGCVKLKDIRTLEGKSSCVVENNSAYTPEIGSGETITDEDHQSKREYKVSNDINVNSSFVALEENPNVILKYSNSSVISRDVASLRQDFLTAHREPMVNAGVEEEGMSDKRNAAVLTDPECLGPCDPGSSVVLEGIVWNESRNGLLVVNVTWRGKTYVGTLMDSSNHNWGSPCFKDGSWGVETREDGEGRRLRRSRGSAQKMSKFSSARSSNTTPIQNSISHFDDPPPSSTLKEFACPVPNCCKRFKSLSGLKTHKCAVLKESSCNKTNDTDSSNSTTHSNAERSLKVSQKTPKFNSSRSKQGAVKRKSHFTDEHTCNGNKAEVISSCSSQIETTKCKVKFSDNFLDSNPINDSKSSNHRCSGDASLSTIKSHNERRGEKLRKNAKPLDNNTNNRKKIKHSRISRVTNNSSDKSNTSTDAFSNEFESKTTYQNIHGNGVIKSTENALSRMLSDASPIRNNVCSNVIKDTFSNIFEASKKKDNPLTLKPSSFFHKSQQTYCNVSGQKFNTKTVCSSPPHSCNNCTKCLSPPPEQGFVGSFDSAKNLVSRPALASLIMGCNKTMTNQIALACEPSSAPTVVSSSKQGSDLFNTEIPLEASTASEVFSQDSKHFKQVMSDAVEDYLFAKKQTN